MKIPQIGEQPLSVAIATLKLTSSFWTESSISFDVKSGGRRGWIDIHHPCQGHVKLQIRGALPEDYLELSKLKAVISAVQHALEIPEDEAFEAIFFKPIQKIGVENLTNGEGMMDRFQTKRVFDEPVGKMNNGHGNGSEGTNDSK